jgi:hypothetical protein
MQRPNFSLAGSKINLGPLLPEDKQISSSIENQYHAYQLWNVQIKMPFT